MDAEQLTTLITAIQKQNEAATKALLTEVVKQLKNESTSGKSTSEPVTLQKFDQFNPKIESFTSYIERFENHLAYINLQDTKKQAQLLCESIGAEHYNNLAAFLGPDNAVSNLTYINLKEKFKQLLQSKKSTILAQHQFLQQTQSANQTIAEYVAQLQKDIIDCDFYVKCNCQNPSSISIADVFLRCQFIRGIRDNWIRLQLLRSNTIEFDNIVKEALALEASKIESKQFNEIQSSSNTSAEKTQNNVEDLEVIANGIYNVLHAIYYYNDNDIKLESETTIIRSSIKVLPFPEDYKVSKFFKTPVREFITDGHHLNMLKFPKTTNLINVAFQE